MKRVSDEPAFVLHRYDWSESSLIIEAFTRRHGRIAVIAKGAKRPSSNFRPVLLPLQPLNLSFGGDAEIRTLKGAEWGGGHVMPTGDALLSGYYINELLLRMLARDDPHQALFDAYAVAVQMLAAGATEIQPAALRAFELWLLREMGLLPQLDMQTLTREPLVEGQRYSLVPEGGLRLADLQDRTSLVSAQWLQLQLSLAEGADFTDTVKACAFAVSGLRPQLRALLNYHCGVANLRTRQMMLDLQSL